MRKDHEAAAILREAIASNLSQLPPVAFYDGGDFGLAMLKRGEPGLFNVTPELAKSGRRAEELNAMFKISREQAVAMSVGAFFGWHVPGADPTTWHYMGKNARGFPKAVRA